MLAVGALAGTFVVAVLLVFAVPVELRFRLRSVPSLQGQVDLRALFGLLRMRRAVSGRPRSAHPAEADERATTRSRPAHWRAPIGWQSLWRDVELRHAVLARTRAALAAVQWRDLRVRVRLGLDDPADTGRLWAALGPLAAAFAGPRAADIAIEPDFAESRLDFEVEGRLTVVPLQLLGPIGLLGGQVGLALARRRLAGGVAPT